MAEKRDSMWLGWMLGLLFLPGSYFLIRLCLQFFTDWQETPAQFPNVPRTQLFSFAVSIIVFRIVSVNRGKIETGKGMLMAIFLITLLYITNLKFHFISF